MEDNLYDALVMAGSVLIFVLALTISMSSFTNMRTQIDLIIDRDTRIEYAKDDTDQYVNYITADSDIREVGVEAIVTSLYRVIKENYNVYINMDNIPTEIKTKSDWTNCFSDKIDTSKGTIEVTLSGNTSDNNSNIEDLLFKKGLYKALEGKKFKEYLGVYQIKTNDKVDSSNKPTYRVITYVQT